MVQIITSEQMNKIINDPLNPDYKGKNFMVITPDTKFVCCDNQDGEAYTEEFEDLVIATKWLNRMFDWV